MDQTRHNSFNLLRPLGANSKLRQVSVAADEFSSYSGLLHPFYSARCLRCAAEEQEEQELSDAHYPDLPSVSLVRIFSAHGLALVSFQVAELRIFGRPMIPKLVVHAAHSPSAPKICHVNVSCRRDCDKHKPRVGLP